MSQPPSQDSNNPERQRREKERDRLQEEWNLKHDRLAELRQSLAVETNAAVKFQLRKQIESDEEEIQDLESRLSELEKFLAGDIDSSAFSIDSESIINQELKTPQSQKASSSTGNEVNNIPPHSQPALSNQAELPHISRYTPGCFFAFALGGLAITLSISFSLKEMPLPSNQAPEPPSNQAPESSQDKINDYLQLEELLRQQKWEEADMGTRSILSSSFSCNSLRKIDRLWSNYSAGRFGLSTQSEFWFTSNGDYLTFSKRVGWFNNGSWQQSYGTYKSGYFPRALWWGIADSKEKVKAVFNLIKACGI